MNSALFAPKFDGLVFLVSVYLDINFDFPYHHDIQLPLATPQRTECHLEISISDILCYDDDLDRNFFQEIRDLKNLISDKEINDQLKK